MKIPYEAFLAGLNVSGRSRPSDKGEPGHPDPAIRGGAGPLGPSPGSTTACVPEVQKWPFRSLNRRPCHCGFFTVVFVIFLITVAASTHLHVLHCHFICLMLLFQGLVTCQNFFSNMASIISQRKFIRIHHLFTSILMVM